MDIPKSHYVYEFSYPERMPELAGIIFYVGKGTNLSRMNVHFQEAAREDCHCAKCEAIRSVWAVGLVVVRNIVFTSRDERATLAEEGRRIIRHYSPHLTNVRLPRETISHTFPKDTRSRESNKPTLRRLAKWEMEWNTKRTFPGRGQQKGLGT